MSIIHRVVRLFVLVALLAMAAVIAITPAFTTIWEALLEKAETGATVVAWIGWGILGLAFLFLFTGVRRGGKKKFLSYDNEGGTVSISTDAISDYVGKLVDEFPSVIKMRPKVVPTKHAIDVRVDIQIKAGPQIHEVCELVQKRVREAITNGLGISDVRRIKVSVGEIVSEHKPA